jgi:ParB-like chromosome segregation protein Spo0J
MKNKVVLIELEKLLAHPMSANVMSKATFKKLAGHIERTGNYEPLVVRRHPKKKGCFEILNGHCREKVLEQLNYKSAECVVWKADDEEALMLLATLNRLRGKDLLESKAAVVKKLNKTIDDKILAGMIPESRGGIAKLRNVSAARKIKINKGKSFMSPVVFFLDEEQKRFVEKAIGAATAGMNGTAAQKRSAGIIKIFEGGVIDG